jgi:preprotein translocase subunit SecD
LVVLLILGGCATGQKRSTLRFHEQVDASLPKAYAQVVEVPRVNLRLTIAAVPTLTERDVVEASLVETAGGAAVLLKFDPHGAIKLDEMTTRARGQRVVVLLDEQPVAVVLIEQRLTTGRFLLEGDFTDEQARQLVDSLNKGAQNQQRKWLNSVW